MHEFLPASTINAHAGMFYIQNTHITKNAPI